MVTDFDVFNYTFITDWSNYQNIIIELENNSVINVPDPYYGTNSGFENVFHLLNQACNRKANRLIT